MKPLQACLLSVLLTPAACARQPHSFEQLQRAGYDDLRSGRLSAAESAAREGRERAEAAHEAAWTRRFRVLEAEVLVSRGRIPDALALLGASSAGDPARDEASVRAQMTRAYARCLSPSGPETRRQDLDALSSSVRLALELGSAQLEGDVLLRRGTCELWAGQHADAERTFGQVLALARGHGLGLLEVSAIGSLGVLRIREGRFDEAVDRLKRALALAVEAKAEHLAAKTRGNIGWCYLMLGDHERALDFLTQCARRSSTADLDLALDRMIALANLGRTLALLGEPARAREAYGEALQIARSSGNRPAEAELLLDLGQIAADQGRYDEAEARAAEAAAITAMLGRAAQDETALLHLLRGGILDGRGRTEEAAAEYHALLNVPDVGWGRSWMARVALARVHTKLGRTALAERELRQAIDSRETAWATLREAEHRLPFYSSLRQPYEDLVDLLVSRGRQQEALALADRSRARLLRERLAGLAAPPAGGADWKRLAGVRGTTLLEYWVAPTRSFLWVVTATGVRVHVLPGAAVLDREIAAYHAEVLRSRDPLHDDLESAQRLWTTLVGPAAADVREGARVVVVPDGPLHRLNLETLVVPGRSPHYWIEDVTLSCAPSLSLLDAARGEARPEEGSLLVLGDPLPHPEFPRLAHAAEEVLGIAGLFPAARRRVLTGALAQPGAYAGAEPIRFEYVHFAAHATTSAERPLESAIVLSPQDETYKLYAREIARVPLRADLVSLSACRSAGARAFAGEGLVGLAWAFMGSGARHVVGGLWDVEDGSTSELMTGLYRGVGSGLAPEVALREAKLTLLRSGTAYRKPFYWAPFVVYTRTLGRDTGRRPRS